MLNTSSTKAVVLGLGINGLALIRSLASRGIEVSGVYCSNAESGRYSRYCRSVGYPDMKNGESDFLSRLITEAGNSKNKPVLMAESDAYVLFMSRNRSALADYFRFLIPEDSLLKTVTQKNTSVVFAAEKGLRTPETHFFDNSSDIEKLVASIPYPCILKPISCEVLFGAKNIRFENPTSLKEFLDRQATLSDQVLIQAVIPGGDANTYQSVTYVTADGTILPIFTMRKIRQYKPDFGITSFGVSENVPAVAEGTRRFLADSQYRGLASIEFKQHPSDGEFYFIEINPRMPMYHSLVLASGLNYPFLYYQDVLGIEVSRESVPPQKNAIHWLCFEKDVGSFLEKYSKRQIGFLPWLFSLFRSRAFAYWEIKDQLPFWHALALFALQKSKSLFSLLWTRSQARAKPVDRLTQ